MRNVIQFAIALFAAALLSREAMAQSGRWGIAINESTKSCARFWEGNACTSVKIPAGWTAVLPDWSSEKQALVLTYKGKSCALGPSSPEKCCLDFGFKFDKDFQAPTEKTARASDPQSECFQIRDRTAPPALP